MDTFKKGLQYTQGFEFDTGHYATLFSILGNSVRLEIFKRILVREWDVGALSEELRLSHSALSQHLARMRLGGLVTTRRDAQKIYYSSTHHKVLEVFRCIVSEGRASILTAANSK